MDEDVKKLLFEEQKRILNELKTMVPGSAEHIEALDSLNTLMTMVNTDRKIDAEVVVALASSKREDAKQELDKARLKNEKHNTRIEGAKAVGAIVAANAIPIFIGYWEHKGWFFSKEALRATTKIGRF